MVKLCGMTGCIMVCLIMSERFKTTPLSGFELTITGAPLSHFVFFSIEILIFNKANSL